MSDSEEEHTEQKKDNTEAEQVLKKRREAQRQESKGLDDAAKELLQSNKEERQRMMEEIAELRQRNERRKQEREVEEKRIAAERVVEEERRKAVEEEKKRKKEEEEQKRQKERANKQAEFEKYNKQGKPNFVISRKEGGGSGDEEETTGAPKKSREQLEAEKKAILNQRIVPLQIDGFDASKLADKAKELHKLVHRLEAEKYDHEKRFKAQQVDMMELAERARQANKVGRGGLKRVQLSEEVDEVQTKFSGAPAKIEMYSKYERQKDKRPYVERKTLYTGPLYGHAANRIKPTKIVKWNEEGLPLYEELGEGAAQPAPAPAPAAEE